MIDRVLSADTRTRVLVLEGLRQDMPMSVIAARVGLPETAVRKVRDEVFVAGVLAALGLELSELAADVREHVGAPPPAPVRPADVTDAAQVSGEPGAPDRVRRQPGRGTAEAQMRTRQILDMIRGGSSNGAIAAAFGVTSDAIRQRRVKLAAQGLV